MVLDIQDHGVASEKPRARRELDSWRVVGAEFQENPRSLIYVARKRRKHRQFSKLFLKLEVHAELSPVLVIAV